MEVVCHIKFHNARKKQSNLCSWTNKVGVTLMVWLLCASAVTIFHFDIMWPRWLVETWWCYTHHCCCCFNRYLWDEEITICRASFAPNNLIGFHLYFNNRDCITAARRWLCEIRWDGHQSLDATKFYTLSLSWTHTQHERDNKFMFEVNSLEHSVFNFQVKAGRAQLSIRREKR